MRQPNAGTSAPVVKAKPVKVRVVKAKAGPTASQVNAATNPTPTHVPKPVKVRATAPPQTPDSRDNNQLARHPNVSHVSPDAQDVAGRSSQQHYRDAGVAQNTQAEMRAKEAYAYSHPKVKVKAKTGGGGGLLASIQPGALGGALSHLAGSYVGAIKHADLGGLEVIPSAAGVVGRSIKDAEEMAVTTPSSVAHLASTAVHHPTKLPGELIAPYKQIAEHPIKSLSDHPLQTALMVAPAIRMPGRALGKVARVAGKQTLERPAAALPGTALKVARTGSRDAVVRTIQSRADRKAPAPVATVKDVQTRVDEFHDMAQHHTQRVVASATKQARKVAKVKGLGKAERRVAVQEKIEGARGGAHTQVDQRFVREFGAVHEITPQGHIVKPKGATEGALHDSHADAQRVADRLNARPAALRTGSGHDTTPLEFTVRPAGDQFGVVPKVAAQRLAKHHVVGTSPATMAKVMRRSRGAFTQAVLPLSPKWLAGQGIEAGIRAGVAGAGPFDLMRFHKVVNELNKAKPGAGDELKMRVTGGHFDLTGPARDFANGKSLADEFEGTSLQRPANAATKIGNTLPAKAVRHGWAQYTRAVLGAVNGAIEQTARRAMAGQAIKNSPLIESHIIGLTDKAIHDAAQGLRGTENQVALGRAVDRMYGQYQKFSPDKRSLLLHWTPFAPWYLNVATFLGKVLPMDHPVQTALLADINATEADWRKQHGLSLEQPNHVPDFLLGSVPHGKGFLRVAHYTPFGVGSDATGALGSLLLPQVTGPVLNALGVDWKGDPLTTGSSHGKPFTPTQKALRALVTIAEEQVPGVQQAGAISGVTPRYVDRDTPSSIKSAGQVLRGYLPTTPTSGAATGGASSSSAVSGVKVSPIKVKPIRVKPIKVKPIKVR